MLCLLYLCLFVSCIQSLSLKRQLPDGDYCIDCYFSDDLCADLEDTDDKTTCMTYTGESEYEDIGVFTRRCYCGLRQKCLTCGYLTTGNETADKVNVKCPCLPICPPADTLNTASVCEMRKDGHVLTQRCGCGRGLECSGCHTQTIVDGDKEVSVQRCWCTARSEPSFQEEEEDDD